MILGEVFLIVVGKKVSFEVIWKVSGYLCCWMRKIKCIMRFLRNSIKSYRYGSPISKGINHSTKIIPIFIEIRRIIFREIMVGKGEIYSR